MGARLQSLVADFCTTHAKDRSLGTAAAALEKQFGYKPRIRSDREFPNILVDSTLNQRVSSLKNGSFSHADQIQFYFYFLVEFLKNEGVGELPEKPQDLFFIRSKNGDLCSFGLDHNGKIQAFPPTRSTHLEAIQTSLEGQRLTENLQKKPTNNTSKQSHWLLNTGPTLLIACILITYLSYITRHALIPTRDKSPHLKTLTQMLELTGPMVTLPGNSQFLMGCDQADTCQPESKPAHSVMISKFQITATEITFAQYDRFCDLTGRRKPDDEGWGRGNRPVINVSWHDANEFIGWLNQQSQLNFRLPTEAEWEYAASDGYKNLFEQGDQSGGHFANGDQDYGWPQDGYPEGTAPVANYAANKFGIHDLLGNVAEWVEDCWHTNYFGAPQSSQRPWLTDTRGNCDRRVHRGGAHIGPIATLQVTRRAWKTSDHKSSYIGFRVARNVTEEET